MQIARTVSTILAVVALGAVIPGCGPSQNILSLRGLSLTYTYVITPDQHARAGEPIRYSVLVRDRATREPIQGGEGRIFAQNIDRAHTADNFVYGPEVGTYHGTLNFVVSGTWAMALQFRRDSLAPLEKYDWQQDVLGERESSGQ